MYIEFALKNEKKILLPNEIFRVFLCNILRCSQTAVNQETNVISITKSIFFLFDQIDLT